MGFLIRTDHTIRELQAIINKASWLVKDRSSTCTIDPHEVLSKMLRGSPDLGSLIAAWIALSERVDLAQKNFGKYQSEYEEEKEENILHSPVSTNSEMELQISGTCTTMFLTCASTGPKVTTAILTQYPCLRPFPIT
jgi:hypothetical protein